MAGRSEYLRTVDPVPRNIERHMLSLGFEYSSDYFDWCWNHGFQADLNKSSADLREEQALFDAHLNKRQKQNRLHKKPKEFLKSVCLGELTSEEIDRPKYKLAAKEIEVSSEDQNVRQSLTEMLIGLLKHDDLLFGTAAGLDEAPLIRGLIKLHDRKALWLRPLETFKPKSKNSLRKFGELTHHLFDQYGDVPHFMEQVWLRNDRSGWRYRDWYVHLGRGYNLRTAKTPVSLTKKMAHHFLQAPDDYRVEQAIRWGQMSALGADALTINALVATPLGRSFANEDFWFTFLRFVADNPMLDPRLIGPLVDYLQNQKFEPMEIEAAPGDIQLVPPPQPGLSLRGRTVSTLMDQMAAWHKSLQDIGADTGELYSVAEFEGYSVEKKMGGEVARWVIRQIRSRRDLKIEGNELHHCVVSYHWSCFKGNCTIWSLAKSTAKGNFERCLTIEVDKHNAIVQCRGFANRDPLKEEWAIVNEWARAACLSVASYF